MVLLSKIGTIFPKSSSKKPLLHVIHFYAFRDTQTTADFRKQQWDAVMWDPPLARPDIVTNTLKNITDLVRTSDGTKYWKVNGTEFDRTRHNRAYARVLKDISEYNSEERASNDENESCDSSSDSWNFNFGLSTGKGGGDIGFGETKSKQKCRKLVSGKSNRDVSDIDDLSEDEEDSVTTAHDAGISDLRVGYMYFSICQMDSGQPQVIVKQPGPLHLYTSD